MIKITVSVTQQQYEWLTQTARIGGISTAELIRRILDKEQNQLAYDAKFFAAARYVSDMLDKERQT